MLDWLPIQGPPDLEQMDAILSKEIPRGSEGPAEYCIHRRTPNKEKVELEKKLGMRMMELRWGYVAIYGDLRDRGEEEDLEKIEQWFARVLRDFKAMTFVIRQAVLEIAPEFKKNKILYERDNQFVEGVWGMAGEAEGITIPSRVEF